MFFEISIFILLYLLFIFLSTYFSSYFFIDSSSQVIPVPAVQRLPAANPGCNQPVWPRHGHRAGQHRFQLRHARGFWHVPPQSQSIHYSDHFWSMQVAAEGESCFSTQTMFLYFRLPVPAGLEPKAWPSPLCQTRRMQRPWMTSKTALKST